MLDNIRIHLTVFFVVGAEFADNCTISTRSFSVVRTHGHVHPAVADFASRIRFFRKKRRNSTKNMLYYIERLFEPEIAQVRKSDTYEQSANCPV